MKRFLISVFLIMVAFSTISLPATTTQAQNKNYDEFNIINEEPDPQSHIPKKAGTCAVKPCQWNLEEKPIWRRMIPNGKYAAIKGNNDWKMIVLRKGEKVLVQQKWKKFTLPFDEDLNRFFVKEGWHFKKVHPRIWVYEKK